MTQDAQVRRLFCLLSQGVSLRLASLKTGMDEKTARKYRKAERMPSELSVRHDWRPRSGLCLTGHKTSLPLGSGSSRWASNQK